MKRFFRMRWCGIAAVGVLLFAVGAARAETDPAVPPARVTPSRVRSSDSFSLTVSGGVSLGAYEAGFLYYAVPPAKGNPAGDLRLLTGASAGSLNALLGVLASCGAGDVPPSESLFWKIWIPVGFEQLFVPSATTPLGIFSREWLARGASHVEEAWNRGIDSSCDVVLGVSTTRVEPRVLHAAGGRLALPRMEEKFAIRIQGRGPGRAPRATNYTAPGSRRREPLLVTDANGEIPFAHLRDLLFASMSFPIAFPPQPVRTCEAGRSSVQGVCLDSEAETSLYIDGGIFDNTPLRLAVGLARDGLREAPGGGVRWRDVPEPDSRDIPSSVVFAFVDPDATEYPDRPPSQARSEEESLPSLVGGVLASFVDTARSKELALLLEEAPEIAEHLVLPRRHLPAASAPLFAFLGFFETQFRVFDFYLGMYDARRMLLDSAELESARTVEALMAAKESHSRRTPFDCMRAVYEESPDATLACQGDDLAGFRALLQVSLDALYSTCGAARGAPADERANWRNPHCERAMAGQAPPRVPGLTPNRWPDWKRGARESELVYSMRLLGAYGFDFHDLGVPPGRGDLAISRIRHALGRTLDRLAKVQPGSVRQPMAFAGKLAADTLEYAPPKAVLHVTMGPTQSEVGLSLGGFERRIPPELRFAGVVGFRGLEELFSSGTSEPFAVTVSGGLEYRPRSDLPFLAQSRFGLRVGWLFSADDRYTTGGCVDRGASSVSACSRPVLQALVGLGLFERFRVQIVGEWYPGSASRASLWSFAPGLGVELGL